MVANPAQPAHRDDEVPPSGLRHHSRAPQYVEIPSRFVRNREMSLDAKGALGYLASLPDGARLDAEAVAVGGTLTLAEGAALLDELRRHGALAWLTGEDAP